MSVRKQEKEGAVTSDQIWTRAAAEATVDPNECSGPGIGPGTVCPEGNPNWGEPLTFQEPRTVRLGVRLTWSASRVSGMSIRPRPNETISPGRAMTILLWRKLQSDPDGILDFEQFIPAERAHPGLETGLVDRADLVSQDSRGRPAYFDSGLARKERVHVARYRQDDDSRAVSVAGVVRDDDRRPRLPDLGSESGVQSHPVDLAPARRPLHRGQCSRSVIAQSAASACRQRSLRAAL
jgi:hypothetical protein